MNETAPSPSEAPAEAPAAPRPGVTTGDVDTELRKLLKDENASPLKKYMAMVLGRKSKLALLKYELLMLLCSGIPGALGIFLRQKLYRHLFRGCGRGVVFGRNVVIRHPHRIVIGDRVVIDDHAVLDAKGDADVTLTIGPDAIIGRNTILSCKGGTIALDQRVNISVNCTLISETSLTIGKKVLIAGHCYLIAGGNHGIERIDIPILEQPVTHKGGVHIGENVWIGANVTVLDGVTLGRDSVVAAGAMVNKPVAEYTIVGGVPAKVLRDRRSGA
jgi:acetyltransferase-like isoleucine patch superfamily enzyme